jgi:radical SAM protein with 4Fe4S-binding SPASM domain
MINPEKYLNASVSLISYCTGTILQKPLISGMPATVGIELTNICNLRCPECLSGSGSMKRDRGFMKEELFNKIISETGDYLLNINLYFQGEPMMHPGFFSFVKSAVKTNVTVSTNGHFLDERINHELAVSGIKRLIISLDGMSKETYTKYRVNGDFDKVIRGIRDLSEELLKTKSSLKIEIQFLVNRFNESQISEAKKLAEDVKASIRLKSMQVINPEQAESWMPEEEKFRRYRKDGSGKYKRKKTSYRSCFRLWMNPVVTWNGKVVPCCFDKECDHVMGDLNESTFRDIWHGEKFRKFREMVLNNREMIEICNNCTTGLRGVSV